MASFKVNDHIIYENDVFKAATLYALMMKLKIGDSFVIHDDDDHTFKYQVRLILIGGVEDETSPHHPIS